MSLRLQPGFDVSARSWVEYAADCHFPIQNLPLGAFADADGERFMAVAIGDKLLAVEPLVQEGLLPEVALRALHERAAFLALREAAFELLESSNSQLRDRPDIQEFALLHTTEVDLAVPHTIGQYVDFYSGIHHASNVGKMFRPDQPPLLPNYRHMPIGYNGRASSVVASGATVTRPNGQTKAPDADLPTFGPTKELDFELEMGFFTADGNSLGRPIPIHEAEEHILGMVIVNDWSARDVQRWEYQPLGPFLSKSFATTISPWIVSLDALDAFRIVGMEQEPAPLPHLALSGPGHFDIHLEVQLKSAKMTSPQVICRSNTSNLYWTIAQQLAHQTSNGTNIRAGDLYASGTISGSIAGSFGSMLELSWRGQTPITLEETGETRSFLADGDEVIMTAWAQGDGYRIGFGESRGLVAPAPGA